MTRRSIDKAVILAAGLGNRISKASAGTPKPLLPIDGKDTTFLDWHLRALAKAGVKEIYIVGNKVTYEAKLVAREEVAGSARVGWILNPTEDISTSGSGHSAWYAWRDERDILDGKSRVVLMDADIVYEPRIYDLLKTEGSSRSKSLVCADFRQTDEEVLVFCEEASPTVARLHGKGLQGTPLADGLVCRGEATGILLLEPGDHAVVRQVTDWVIRFSTAKTRSEHEDITQRMMTLGRVELVPFGRDLLFMECDTPDEYTLLTTEMYPKIAARL